MASYGLLAGLGRGLSQGAELLNRGMAEDRAVERERQREESIAKRWARQEAREDARYADEKKYRDDRNKVEDQRYNEQKSAQAATSQQAQSNWQKSYNLQERQMSAQEESRRVQRVEETLNRIQSKYSREGEQIDRRYERLIDKAETPEEKQALYEQRDREHTALGTKLEGEMVPALKSFGDGLKGTSYASYLDVLAEMGKPKPEEDPKPEPAPAPSNRVDAVNNVLNQPGSQPAPTAAGNPMPTPGLLKPGFFNGFIDSAYGDVNPMQIDETNITPAQLATTRTGQALGYFPGKFVDAVQQVGQAAQPAWNYLNNPMNQGRK